MSRRSPVIALALLVPLLVAGLSPLTAPPVRAEAPRQDRPIQLTARAGFDGYVQTDAWTPVRVEASNDGADISGEIRVTVDPFTGTRTHYTRPLDLPRGSRKQVTLYVADIAAFGGQVEVELLDARGRVLLVDAARVQTVAPTTLLIGVWSDAPQGLAALARVEPASGETRVAALTADDLPAEARGWEALDVLVVADADTGQLSLAQREALSAWVAGGGRLVIVGGLGFQRTLAGLADLTPVRARQTEAVRLDALQEMAGGAGARVAGEAPVAVGPLTGDARVALAQDGVPLVAWRPLGYGRVDFFAPDPNLAPLNRWDGLEAVWRSILARGEARPAWAYGFSGQWEYARQAVAAVPGITLPSVLQLSAFLALYVVLIGPVNYVVLTRLNRRELAWVTIPALIVLFSVVAYVTGFQLRGSRAILHRLAVVQSWEGSDLAQVDGLVGVWSPRRARYDVDLEAGVLAQPLPRDLGGALTAGGDVHVSQGEAVTLRDVSVDVGSISPFAVQGYLQAAPGVSADLSLEPQAGGVRVWGRVYNAGSLDLNDASLVVGGAHVPLGALPAGGTVDVDEILEGGQASRAAGSGLEPYPLDATGYYGGPDETLISGVSGGECFGAPDIQRRCNLFRSVLAGQAGGAGAYLFGWADTVPFETEIVGGAYDPDDLALHIVQLDLELAPGGQGRIEVPPGLMTWQVLDEQEFAYNRPYDLYMYPGQKFGFRFEPLPVVPPLDVESFTIHLETLYGNEVVPILRIRNVQSGRWDTLNAQFGSIVVGRPELYVDAAGGVEMRLVGSSESIGTQISRFDLTLYGSIATEGDD